MGAGSVESNAKPTIAVELTPEELEAVLAGLNGDAIVPELLDAKRKLTDALAGWLGLVRGSQVPSQID